MASKWLVKMYEKYDWDLGMTGRNVSVVNRTADSRTVKGCTVKQVNVYSKCACIMLSCRNHQGGQ